MTLRFNKDSVIGETHHLVTDHGSFWKAESWLFKHSGDVLRRHVDTYSRDVLTHQIVAAQVTALEAALSDSTDEPFFDDPDYAVFVES